VIARFARKTVHGASNRNEVSKRLDRGALLRADTVRQR
jgi:hypothetical protein